MTQLKINYDKLDNVAENYQDHSKGLDALIDALTAYKRVLEAQKARAHTLRSRHA